MKPSERCQQDAELMMAFRNAFVDLVNNSRPQEGATFLPELGPGIDHQSWQAKHAAVAAAAGAAARPYLRYGGLVTLRNAAYITPDVHPVMNWEMSLRDPEQFRPHTLVATVEAAIAQAKQEAADASRRETGLTGLIAAFLRWPSNLREAVGAGRPGQRRAAGAIGVAGQVVVATVAGALSIGLAAAAVKLWGALTS